MSWVGRGFTTTSKEGALGSSKNPPGYVETIDQRKLNRMEFSDRQATLKVGTIDQLFINYKEDYAYLFALFPIKATLLFQIQLTFVFIFRPKPKSKKSTYKNNT